MTPMVLTKETTVILRYAPVAGGDAM